MIMDVNASNLSEIQNPALREYAGRYVAIYQDFMQRIREFGLEIDPQDTSGRMAEKAAGYGKNGPVVRNDAKSFYLNRISPACLACQTASASSTFFLSLKCHRDCFYCFNPNQQDFEYNREHLRDLSAELGALQASRVPVRHLALTGGEPLLFKPQTYAFFEQARALFPAAHTRLYTSGDHIDRAALEALRQAGLNEIRFSIRMHDLSAGQRHTFERIALAREFIPNVMVEMPVLPGTLEEMKGMLRELDGLGIFGINLLELCFPLNNAEAFRQRDYRIKARPFRVLYDYWYAGGLPIAGSEEVCLGLIDYALEAGLKLGVHYCSLENKHTGQIYQQNTGHHLPRRVHFSQRDYFLKTAKVFGEDIPRVQKFFDKNGYKDYELDSGVTYLEFHPSQVSSLKKLDPEIGICSSVIETRDNAKVVRELKVDLTRPAIFRFSKDI